ncbi:MAG: SDR family NAD(P)-dependent oxidoreductase [Cyanobacteria bacterium P01_A01_bin.114]
MNSPHRPIALITGASSGIGHAIALRLAKDGYDLAICARREARLFEIRDELMGLGADVLVHTVDLRQESQILDCFSAVQDRWDQLDVLINNAGLGHKENLTTGTTESWRETLEVNVLALSICTREAIKLMRAKGDRGHVVHISSMSGHRVPGSGMYSASKFAVRALTEGLRQELRAANSGIRVSSISPGFVETEFAEKYHQSAEKAAAVYSQFPVLQPEDIANAIEYVLSQPDYVQVHDILLRPTQQAS